MVHFVGAGPGAVDLITIRGANLLKEADCIIYAGSLVNKELLNYASDSCELFDSAYMTLEEVIEVIQKNDKNNKMIVRLHTGDPCLYGAIREQMDKLDELNIKYEYVAGVSSFCGAAQALKTEYTLPDVSQTVIITRVEGRTPVPDKEKLHMLATHQATMVLFLSVGLVDKVVDELLLGGYTKETPVAVVYKATWEDEKVFNCTIDTLAKTVKDNKITKTALITIGNFLGNEYERSKLYDPTFTTEYRKGSDLNA